MLITKSIKFANENARDHYAQAVHSICNLRYKILKEIPIVFHNGSKYDYNFIKKEVAVQNLKGKLSV